VTLRVRAGQDAAARGSARPEAATMARAAGDLAAAAAAARGEEMRRWWWREGGAAGSLGGGRRRRVRGKWRRRAGHARGRGRRYRRRRRWERWAAVMVARVGRRVGELRKLRPPGEGGFLREGRCG
jgi:hypothetical protein